MGSVAGDTSSVVGRMPKAIRRVDSVERLFEASTLRLIHRGGLIQQNAPRLPEEMK